MRFRASSLFIFQAACASGLLTGAPAPAERHTIIEIRQGESFEEAVNRLTPGAVLILHQGVYADAGRLSIRVKGTPAEPVVIKGAEGEPPPLITRAPSASVQNTLNIEGATYVTIKGLEITGNGGDGINLRANPSHITLENLHIHGVDVGINFRSDMHHITVRRNHIHHTGATGRTGEGLYVGCNYAECAVSHSVIEGNWIHDTMSASQGDGIEIKRGSHSNTIRDNVIHDTHYPCILLYGTEGNPRNLVEGNVMWNCGDSGIQAAADAVIRNNLILDSPENGFNSQKHQSVLPQDLDFVHNTVVGGSPCIRLDHWSKRRGMVFANNAVYCRENAFVVSGLESVTISGNVFVPATKDFPSGGYTSGRSAALDFVNPEGKNMYPAIDSPLLKAGDSLYSVPADFNGTTRTGRPDAGAYAWTGPDNPGWRVGAEFKSAYR